MRIRYANLAAAWILVIALSACASGTIATQHGAVLTAIDVTEVAAGDQITITGSGFYRDADIGQLVVSMCGVQLQNLQLTGSEQNILLPGGASVTTLVGNTISGTVPAGAIAGTSDVTVTLPDGRQLILKDAVDCLPTPTPTILNFSANPVSAMIGDAVAFSWDIAYDGSDPLTCTLLPLGESHALVITPDCNAAAYTHTYNAAGNYEAVLTVINQDEEADSATVNIVIHARQPPKAVDDAITVSADDLPLAIPVANLLSNDTISPSNTTVSLFGAPEHVTLDDDTNTLTFNPGTAFGSVQKGSSETFVFAYQVTDERGNFSRAAATVTIDGTAEIRSVQIEPESLSVAVTQIVQLTANVDVHGTPATDVTWESSNEAIVTVSTDGLITAMAAGQATVTAVSVANPGVSDCVQITVVEPFTLVIDPALGGVNKEFKLLLSGTGTIIVNWGDGSEPEAFSLTESSDWPSHAYSDTAERVAIQVVGDLPGGQFGNGSEHIGSQVMIKEMQSWGDLGITSLSGAFSYAPNLNLLPDHLPGEVEDLSELFYYNTRFNLDIGVWDTSRITDMSEMFAVALGFSRELKTWNTSRVTDMSNMFYDAIVFTSDLSSWDTGRVTNMSSMFSNAYEFTSNLSGWSTGQVTDMSLMFMNARVFDSDISGWDTSRVTDMFGMFSGTEKFNSKLVEWDTGQVTDMDFMFSPTAAFNEKIGTWNTGNVQSMDFMFMDAGAFNQDISSWCVEDILEEPNDFADRSPLIDAHKPKWGASCTTTTPESPPE